MNSKIRILAPVLSLLFLSGCATMSGDECMTSDWRAIGYEDGLQGYTGDRIGQHRKACAKHGVTPDLTAYTAGREQGLSEYCQPSRGFHVGANGGSYYGVCAAHYEADFVDAYNAGRHLYILRSNVNRANSAISSKEREIDRIDQSIVDTEVALIADETTADERLVLLLDLKNLAERKGELEAQIRELYDDRARYRAELENYQVIVADMGY
ncbi:MAG: DUF2799 domain-containing protein [Pseudomonadota bacterium]